uniref:Death domain-containing protein n=1 Tax=Amphimedon queenslandica TaxID=400682 RepID=A0A1X7TXB5_AMPQE
MCREFFSTPEVAMVPETIKDDRNAVSPNNASTDETKIPTNPQSDTSSDAKAASSQSQALSPQVEEMEITEATRYIEAYRTDLEEFCNLLSISLCLKERFASISHLQCETVTFIFDWEPEEHVLKDIKDILSKVSGKLLVIEYIETSTSICVTCSFPFSDVGFTVLRMIENIHILMGQGLKKLIIGNLTLWRRQDVRQKVVSYIILKETEYELKDAISSKEKETIKLNQKLSIMRVLEEESLSLQRDTESIKEVEEEPLPLDKKLTILISQFHKIKEENKEFSGKLSKMKVDYLRKLHNNTDSEIQVQVEKRMTLAQLKEELVPLIGVPPTGFGVYRVSDNEEYEMEGLYELLKSGSKLIVRLGRALRRGEKRIKLYLLQVKNTEFCKYMMYTIYAEGTPVREFKKQVIEEAKVQEIEIDCVLELDKMRLRNKRGVSPGRVYFDDEWINTSREMYVEPLKGVDDLVDVLDLLKRCGFPKANWYELGLRLGLKKNTLDIIEKNHPHDVSRCMTECLSQWLGRADNVDSRGGANLDSLSDALRSMNETAVAEKLKHHVLINIFNNRHTVLSQSLCDPVSIAWLLYGERMLTQEAVSRVVSASSSIPNQREALLTGVKEAVQTDPNSLHTFANVLCRISNFFPTPEVGFVPGTIKDHDVAPQEVKYRYEYGHN